MTKFNYHSMTKLLAVLLIVICNIMITSISARAVNPDDFKLHTLDNLTVIVPKDCSFSSNYSFELSNNVEECHLSYDEKLLIGKVTSFGVNTFDISYQINSDNLHDYYGYNTPASQARKVFEDQCFCHATKAGASFYSFKGHHGIVYTISDGFNVGYEAILPIDSFSYYYISVVHNNYRDSNLDYVISTANY